MSHECLVCGDQEGETTLLALSCRNHHVCMNPESQCLAATFSNAIYNEQSYPVKCCNDVLLIDDYQEFIPDLIPFDLYMTFKEREQEYATHPRYRLYCSNKACGEFLHRQNYRKIDSISCAKCDRCSTYTCTYCKNSVQEKHICDCLKCTLCRIERPEAMLEHECTVSEEDRRFKDAVKEHGFQECPGCGGTVELAEACNHMTCSCGYEFCYICGKVWNGYHGCPRYGQPVYDDDGYNQDGFHRITGADRAGFLRDGVEFQEHDEDEGGHEEEDDADQEEDDGGFDMTGIDEETRQLILALPQDMQQDVWEQARFAAIDRGDIVPPGEDERDDDGGENAQPADNGGVHAAIEDDADDADDADSERSSTTRNTPIPEEEESETNEYELAIRPADLDGGDAVE